MAAIRTYRLMTLACSLALLTISPSLVLSSPNTLVRDSIPEQYKWDLSNIYPDWGTWERDYAHVSDLIDSLTSLQGHPSKGGEQLAEVLLFKDSVSLMTDWLSLFAGLLYVTNMSDNALNGYYQRIQNLEARLAEATSWLEPELLLIPRDTINSWQSQQTGLAAYQYWLDNLYRRKQHFLDDAQEKLLAYFGTFNSTPGSIYSDFIYSDIQYPDYVTTAGDTILLTESQTWYQMRVNRNQDERRQMFQTFYGAYQDYVNTYAAVYNSVLQRDWATARARNYENTLDATLDYDNVPVEVYQNLVNTVRQGTEPMKRYHRLRKSALGLENYYWSDRKSPLVDFDRTYEYDEVVPWMAEAFSNRCFWQPSVRPAEFQRYARGRIHSGPRAWSRGAFELLQFTPGVCQRLCDHFCCRSCLHHERSPSSGLPVGANR
jgi:oligoendopeptidase F